MLGSNDEAGGYASEQGENYRRGFVMGLTLAEAALLLIFVILLLLVIGFERRNAEIVRLAAAFELVRENSRPDENPAQAVARIASELSQFTELKEVVEAAGARLDDDFLELVKVAARESADFEDTSLMQKLRDERDRLERAASLAEAISSPEDLEMTLTRMAELEDLTKNQAGQVLELRDRLKRTGLGGDLPSCWTTPQGRPAYLLEVVLESGGVRVSDAISENRAEERSRLPIGRFSPEKVLSENVFIEATRPIFDWSVKNECRFYVDVFDATESHEKSLYKSRMRTVEGHFYKRQRDGRASF